MLSFMHKEVMCLDKNGIYIDGEEYKSDTQFSSDVQNNLFEIEDKSWWFQYRAKVIESFASVYFDKTKLTVDIGGGNGYTTSILSKLGFNMGLLEPSYQACVNGKKRQIPYVKNGSIEDMDHPIDQYMLLDVLEHIEDDDKFLDLIYGKMNLGGVLLITVPAFMSLWSREDLIAGHFRRYKKDEICDKLVNHGFEVLYENYFFSFLYVPVKILRVWLGRFKKRNLGEVDNSEGSTNDLMLDNSFVYKILGRVEKLELKRLINRKSVPFGSSIIIVCKK